MKMTKETSPEVYQFKNGNWVVNKNEQVAFCALGTDNAHVNRSIKVSDGLIPRTNYFLVAHELSKLAEQAKLMDGTSFKKVDST